MGWENTTGERRILPSGMGGGVDEVKLETDKPKKVRLLLIDGQEPYSFLEHAVEYEAPKDGGGVEKTFRTVRCPRTTSNPNAHCPLCDGQRFRLRARHAANVWDYELNKVQKLVQGEDVWKSIGTTRKMGIDVTGVDWALLRSGKDRNDTSYSATNLGTTAFSLPADAQLFDIESDYRPNTVDEMQAIVESAGCTWQYATTPPALEYPTLEAALAHVMPNGKYKGQTFKQMWEADQSNRGMINFLATKSDRISPEKAAAQVILVNLGGANIDGVPRNGAPSTIQPPQQTPPPAQQTPPPASGGTASANRDNKIKEINNIFGTDKDFVDGGFQKVIEALKQASGGKTNIQDFTDAELDTLHNSIKK